MSFSRCSGFGCRAQITGTGAVPALIGSAQGKTEQLEFHKRAEDECLHLRDGRMLARFWYQVCGKGSAT